MPDYNIYIHALNTSSPTSNQTIPWTLREEPTSTGESNTTPHGGASIGAFGIASRIAAIAQNPDSIVAGATSGLMKAAPYIAAAAVVVKLSIAAKETALGAIERELGDYRHSIAWENLKTNVNVITHPFSSTVQHFRTVRQISLNNQRVSLQRELFGDSVINSYTNRGV